MKKGNNLRVYSSTVPSEGVRGTLQKILETNYTINQTQTKDRIGKTVTEVTRVAQKKSRRNEAIFTINIWSSKVFTRVFASFTIMDKRKHT